MNLEEAIQRVDVPESSVLKRTLGLLRFMTIAEEEIAAFSNRYPRFKSRIRPTFASLAPGILVEYRDELYRHHVRELLLRSLKRQSLRPGTGAEVMVALNHASLIAPLNSDHTTAFARMFLGVFPERADIAGEERESYPGAVDEIVTELRRKIGERINR